MTCLTALRLQYTRVMLAHKETMILVADAAGARKRFQRELTEFARLADELAESEPALRKPTDELMATLVGGEWEP